MDNANNPHGVTANHALALPITGGTLEGPLFLSREPLDPTEASRKSYVDRILQTAIVDISRLDSALITAQVDIDGLNTDIISLEASYTSYVNSPQRVSGYHFDKTTASTSWTIVHNLNSKKLSISVFDDSDEQVFPDTIKKIDSNMVNITFLLPVKGSVEVILIGS
jgi:hypothetical protein